MTAAHPFIVNSLDLKMYFSHAQRDNYDANYYNNS
jgi:hypothetical protein